jgi:hypothetical protein
MDTKKKQLTMKQENFCREYLLCGNASEAYRRAYNVENMKPETIWNEATKMLKNPVISTRINELKSDLEELLGITKATEIKELIRIKNRCLKPEPKMIWQKNEHGKMEQVQETDEDGNLVWTFDSAGANAAQDKILKAMGYYAPEKSQLIGKNGTPVDPSPTTIVVNIE